MPKTQSSSSSLSNQLTVVSAVSALVAVGCTVDEFFDRNDADGVDLVNDHPIWNSVCYHRSKRRQRIVSNLSNFAFAATAVSFALSFVV